MNSFARDLAGLQAQDDALIGRASTGMRAFGQDVHPFKVPRCLTPSYEPGVSLVTACMNRNANLIKAVKSWLAHVIISEVVIVDWCSDEPVSTSLQNAGILDPRIRIIRVEGEGAWVLSLAFNLGFRMARFDRILKADADIILGNDFFLQNPLQAHELIAGNWRTAAAGQQYVNGFFYLHSADLARVNGFSEFIQSYGHDDDDLYDRLVALGLARKDVAAKTVQHIDHSDHERLTCTDGRVGACLPMAKETLAKDTLFLTRRNRFLSMILPAWSEDRTMQPFETDPEIQPSVRRAGVGPHVTPSPIAKLADTLASYERLSWQIGREVFDLSQGDLEHLIGTNRLGDITKETLSSLDHDPVAASPVVHLTERLFIDAQHGLGNRLRAIASAATIAEAEGRQLVVIWQPDHHCHARLSDLLDYSGPVIEASFPQAASDMGMDVTTYMEIEEGAAKDTPILPLKGRDYYLRSAYVGQHPASTWEAENAVIRALTPSEQVRRLLAPFPSRFDLALHIRMEGCSQTDENSYDNSANWTEASHGMITHWRGQSHFTKFAQRLEPLLAENGTARVFLAADMAATYEAFGNVYANRITYLPRERFDRSAEQLQYALADMILLSRARHLLGSHWSSFTEGAMRFSTSIRQTELAGIDF